MAHFAQLNSDNVVTNIIVLGNNDITDVNGIETEEIGISLCQRYCGAGTKWKQTSYNNRIRGNYAGIGYTYMENVATLGVGSTDIFIPQQPYDSWSISTTEAVWEAPLTEPTLTDDQIAAGSYYTWDESAYQADNTTGWTLVTPE
tara:strand:- start:35 stop:469 length:435 start_codon:yes stop_codon:yes gene_type:complete